MAKNSYTIPESDLLRMRLHPTLDIISLIGKRLSVLMSRNPLDIIQRHMDEDINENYLCSEFYSEWNIEKKQNHFLLLAGKMGIIKIIDIKKPAFILHLKGHGGAINDLKVKNGFLFSASEDMTIRMWNMKTKKVVQIFGGYAGHRDHVLSVSISLCGKYLVSAGTDCMIKLWRIPENPTKLECQYFPIYSSSLIHRSYISIVEFYGQLVASKSISNRIVFIKPILGEKLYGPFISSESVFVAEFKCSQHTLTRFSIADNFIFTGTKEGKIGFYNLNEFFGGTIELNIKDIGISYSIRDIGCIDNTIYILTDGSQIFARKIRKH
ncbi:Polycomb protein eed [Astathelohania contejeani]|uniref:Polycomb protein eed n=1 Tax=Astathelohania contejeani TaxID=164912 RepID=A0ABQ7HZC6_9MICR|nr:Polycomb protein eed [Thelohania contejeani]